MRNRTLINKCIKLLTQERESKGVITVTERITHDGKLVVTMIKGNFERHPLRG